MFNSSGRCWHEESHSSLPGRSTTLGSLCTASKLLYHASSSIFSRGYPRSNEVSIFGPIEYTSYATSAQEGLFDIVHFYKLLVVLVVRLAILI